jgi:hypothetical protein
MKLGLRMQQAPYLVVFPVQMVKLPFPIVFLILIQVYGIPQPCKYVLEVPLFLPKIRAEPQQEAQIYEFTRWNW